MKNIKPYRPTKREWLEFKLKMSRIGGALNNDKKDREERIAELRKQGKNIRRYNPVTKKEY